MSLPDSIQKTIRYASYFHFPLTVSELHHWLISPKIYSLDDISSCSIKINSVPKVRLRLSEIAKQKEVIAGNAVKIIRQIPSVRLIALTGSVAINNAKATDDIDLFIITSSHTLWLTRLLVLLLIKPFFKTRSPNVKCKTKNIKYPNSLCFNLWLDESTLDIPSDRRNLYTAHEVLQAKPLFDRGGAHSRFILANAWTKDYLANAYHLTKKSPTSPTLDSRFQILDSLNKIAFKLQRFRKTPHPNELVTLHAAYFHPRDLSRDLESYIIKP